MIVIGGAALALALVEPAAAADPDPVLTALYRLALSAEVCGFPVSTKQADAIGKKMDERLAALKLSDEEADTVSEQIEAGMAAEGWDKLCAKDGAWAKTYADEVKKFGK